MNHSKKDALAAGGKSVTIPAAVISLSPSEHYAGLVLDAATGQPGYHLVLLPGAPEDLTWDEAQAWAEKMGGRLPTRQEQGLLLANLKREFERTWYWSGEKLSGSAWTQHLSSGNQRFSSLDDRLRARAVRRVGMNGAPL